MASSSLILQQIMTAEPELDDLDSSLMCPVCLDLLFDPYGVIPCKHTFCETCLRRIGSKDPMNTFCPMCRQRIVYCEVQPDLAMSIRESYPDLYKKRKTSEKSTNVYNLPLPWRPGWRNLVSGRGLGGNPIGTKKPYQILKNNPKYQKFIFRCINIFRLFEDNCAIVALLHSPSGHRQLDQHGFLLLPFGSSGIFPNDDRIVSENNTDQSHLYQTNFVCSRNYRT